MFRGIAKSSQDPRRPQAKKSAFTLMEVLIVLVIITILAGVVGLNLLRKPGEARIAAAKMQIKTLQSAVNLYYTEQHNYPTQSQGLEALVKKPASEPQPANYPPGGYLESRLVPNDPWGNPYIYLCPGRKGEPFEIFSYGPDGESSGEKGRGEISSSNL